jgi:hypothetical protein
MSKVIEDAIARSQAWVANEEVRLKALRALREEGLHFDPSGADAIVLWVASSLRPDDPAVPLRAVRVTEDGGWLWQSLDDGDTRQGHWSALLSEVCDGHHYPVSVSRGRMDLTVNLLRGVAHDPREV